MNNLHFLLIAIFLFIYIFLSYVIDKKVYNKAKHINGTILLPDIIHSKITSNHKLLQKVVDFTTMFVLVSYISYFLWVRKHSLIVLYLIILIALQILCKLISIITVLPDSKNGECDYVESKNIFTKFKKLGSCNNLNISGHLLTIGVALYLLSRYQNHKYSPIYILVYTIMFFLIPASRNHYTIDCVNSTFVLLLIIAYMDTITGTCNINIKMNL